MGGRQPLLASWLLCQRASLCGVPSLGLQAGYGSCKHEQVSIGLAGCLLFAHATTHFEEASGGVRMLEEPEDAEVYAIVSGAPLPKFGYRKFHVYAFTFHVKCLVKPIDLLWDGVCS